MLPLRRFLFLLPVLLVTSAGSSAAQGLPPVVVSGEPVAPSPDVLGTGLCSASSRSDNPALDFPQSSAAFNGGINTFLETKASSRITSVLRTPLDLSNNNSSGTQASYGDFRNAVLGCPMGGCGFFINDTTTSFATRLRGLLHVPSDKVNKALHFGLYADDAVSVTLFDRTGTRYEVINRPPQLGVATWRTTNSVTFTKPGLYPIEVLYAEVSEHAALELSMLEGAFTDFERSANDAPINLESAGFELVTPEMFYLSESGRPSHPEPAQCVQCNRQYANTSGSNGCTPGFHCNSAALCSPCDSAAFCGASCSPCGASTPFCAAQGEGFARLGLRGSRCVPRRSLRRDGHLLLSGRGGWDDLPGRDVPGGRVHASGRGLGGWWKHGPGWGQHRARWGRRPGCLDPRRGWWGHGRGGSAPGDDGGTTGGGPDAGLTSDAGTGPGGGDENPNPDEAAGGCGCGTGARALAPLSLLGLAFLMRRVRRTRFE
jgi:outer membrane exchange protein TraA